MANTKETSITGRSKGTGTVASNGSKGLNRPGGKASGSVLTQEAVNASPSSKRVIKKVSHDHRDALKRLVDR